MTNVIPFPKHDLRPIPQMEGLTYCTRCLGAEGSLPTDCPGRKLTAFECEQILDGELDYWIKQGGWTTHTRGKALRIKGQYE